MAFRVLIQSRIFPLSSSTDLLVAIFVDHVGVFVVAHLINKKGGRIIFSKDELLRLEQVGEPKNLPKFDNISIEPVKIDMNYAYKFTQENLYLSIHLTTLNKLVFWFPFIDKLTTDMESLVPKFEKFLDEFKRYPKSGQTTKDLRSKLLYTINDDSLIEFELICIYFNFLMESEF